MKVGSYVKTSRGNVGVVDIAQHYEIGYYIQDEWNNISTFIKKPRESSIDWFKSQHPNEHVEIKLFPNIILLGNKAFQIWDNKLTPLDNVRMLLKNKE